MIRLDGPRIARLRSDALHVPRRAPCLLQSSAEDYRLFPERGPCFTHAFFRQRATSSTAYPSDTIDAQRQIAFDAANREPVCIAVVWVTTIGSRRIAWPVGELSTPKILRCPCGGGGLRVTGEGAVEGAPTSLLSAGTSPACQETQTRSDGQSWRPSRPAECSDESGKSEKESEDGYAN